jgi:hypothetical protein
LITRLITGPTTCGCRTLSRGSFAASVAGTAPRFGRISIGTSNTVYRRHGAIDSLKDGPGAGGFWGRGGRGRWRRLSLGRLSKASLLSSQPAVLFASAHSRYCSDPELHRGAAAGLNLVLRCENKWSRAAWFGCIANLVPKSAQTLREEYRLP